MIVIIWHYQIIAIYFSSTVSFIVADCILKLPSFDFSKKNGYQISLNMLSRQGLGRANASVYHILWGYCKHIQVVNCAWIFSNRSVDPRKWFWVCPLEMLSIVFWFKYVNIQGKLLIRYCVLRSTLNVCLFLVTRISIISNTPIIAFNCFK